MIMFLFFQPFSWGMKLLHPYGRCTLQNPQGVDGYPALFYQQFWHVIGGDVLRFFLGVLNGNTSPASVNDTLIALIPKVKKPMHASQFRPISLCNVLFK